MVKNLWYWSNPDEGGYYVCDPNHTPSQAGGYIVFVCELTEQQAHLLLALVPNCVSEHK